METNSDRCDRALDALKSESMPLVICVVILAHPKKSLKLLAALSDPFVDALCVVMYAGRDEFSKGHPYDDVEAEFREWWDYLSMDGEHFAREQMASKAPLSDYLTRGAYMFRIDGVVYPTDYKEEK